MTANVLDWRSRLLSRLAVHVEPLDAIEVLDRPVTVGTEGQTAATARPTATAGHNTFDDLTDVRDPNGNVTYTGYDRLGRTTGIMLPDYTPPGATAPLTLKVEIGDLDVEADGWLPTVGLHALPC